MRVRETRGENIAELLPRDKPRVAAGAAGYV